MPMFEPAVPSSTLRVGLLVQRLHQVRGAEADSFHLARSKQRPSRDRTWLRYVPNRHAGSAKRARSADRPRHRQDPSRRDRDRARTSRALRWRSGRHGLAAARGRGQLRIEPRVNRILVLIPVAPTSATICDPDTEPTMHETPAAATDDGCCGVRVLQEQTWPAPSALVATAAAARSLSPPTRRAGSPQKGERAPSGAPVRRSVAPYGAA